MGFTSSFPDAVWKFDTVCKWLKDNNVCVCRRKIRWCGLPQECQSHPGTRAGSKPWGFSWASSRYSRRVSSVRVGWVAVANTAIVNPLPLTRTPRLRQQALASLPVLQATQHSFASNTFDSSVPPQKDLSKEPCSGRSSAIKYSIAGFLFYYVILRFSDENLTHRNNGKTSNFFQGNCCNILPQKLTKGYIHGGKELFQFFVSICQSNEIKLCTRNRRLLEKWFQNLIA